MSKDKASSVKEILEQLLEKVIIENGSPSLTGAQIKGISESVIAYAVSEKIDRVTLLSSRKPTIFSRWMN